MSKISKYIDLDPNPFNEYRGIEVGEAIEIARKEDAKDFWNKNHKNFKKRYCPSCSFKRSTPLESYLGLYPVVQCDCCSLIYVSITPTQDALNDYYQNAKSIKLLNDFYSKRKNTNLVSESRLSLVSENLPRDNKPIHVLEIGCSHGSFLQSLKEKSNERELLLYGVEPNKKAAELAREKGINVSELYLGSEGNEQIPNEASYDLILCFELIEHLINPKDLFNQIYKKLKPNGKLIITTPNVEGLGNICSEYNNYRLITHSISPPMHLQGFSRVSLAVLASDSGFCIESIDAKGSFDAYELVAYAEKDALSNKFNDFFTSLFKNDHSWNELCINLQNLVNSLNASSAITAVFTKG